MPYNFWLFLMLKTAFRGVRFTTNVNVQTTVQKALKAIPAKEFEKTMMQKWQEQMQGCIIKSGKHFEKVSVDGNVTDTE